MLDSLKQQIDQCQHGDSFRFARQMRLLEKSCESKTKKKRRIEELAAKINASKARCLRRANAIPDHIWFPEDLPVSSKSDEISNLLKHNQVLVIAGDTGSGKTTQIPKMCLNAGFGRRGIIGHTQPRRLAAVSVANRIAEELKTNVGLGVGYQVRFNEKLSENTYLKLMTDGILLSEIQNDKFLNKYDVLIIDEAHERSLNIDFLLGYLFQLLKKRRELKLIITSATIDVKKFAKHFSNAPIVSISGKTYPVETLYRPQKNIGNEASDLSQKESIFSAIGEILNNDLSIGSISGDVLIFLSSEREIRETAIEIRKRKLPHTEVLPLYSRLQHSEQIKIFSPHKGRRIILATNIAETSITVPGIKYVIDTGLARISRYSIQSKVQRLPIEPISQASANQRQGRCGRVSDGICIRLYSEEEFNARPLYTDPEIKRTNLASVILQMLALRLGDVENFPYLDQPGEKAINDGLKILIELNAITQKHVLTATGKEMARLPVDPTLARMIVVSNSYSCLRELLIIVSALSIRDPREMSASNRAQAREKLAKFSHEDSDFLSLISLWDDFELKRQNYSQSQLRKYCQTNFLSYMRMREWRDVHRSLLVTSKQLGYRLNKTPGSYKAIHKAIIAGSLNQIAVRIDNKTYQGTRNRKFTIFSSSVATRAKAKWLVTGELVETTETFASMAAKIQPHWVEEMALHLVKREYFQPHWSKKTQTVMAYEKVHLYGLSIIEKSLVDYSSIDLTQSRTIYITHALVSEGTNSKLDFLTSNRRFIEVLAKEEEKLRRPELLIGDREIESFYDERIPRNICSTKDLENWFHQASKSEKSALYMTHDNVVSNRSFDDHSLRYPDQTSVLRNRLSIDYVFDPGSTKDGATIEIPQQILNQIEQVDIDWAIPGIIKEKCICLLKGLPKSLRKTLIPINGLVDEMLSEISSADGTLLDAVISYLASNRRIQLSRDDFIGVELPHHLRTKIKLIDAQGNEVGYSEDVEGLRQEFLGVDNESKAINGNPDPKGSIHKIQKQGLKDWEIEDLPEYVEIGKELVIVRYPAFVDYADTVAIELFADSFMAANHNRSGLARLFMLRTVPQRNLLKKRFTRFLKEQALLIPPDLKNMVDEVIFACYVETFSLDNGIPRTRQKFQELLDLGRPNLYRIGEKTATLLENVLKKRFEIIQRLREFKSNELSYFVLDIEQQLDNLMPKELFLQINVEHFEQYPRYLRAIEVRLDKAPHLGKKDKDNTELIGEYWNRFEDLKGQVNISKQEEVSFYRWMLEEFRVSLFAQSLGTNLPVSIQRLEKQLKLIKS